MSIKVTIEIGPTTSPSESYEQLVKTLLETVAELNGQIQVKKVVGAGKKTRRKARTITRRRELSGTPAEQWATFIEEAPSRTREFVQFIQESHPNFLMQSDAMSRLDMTPRAIGGLTGTLRRWAMADGLSLPWVATRIDGNRAWLWCGFDENGSLNPPPESFESVNAQNLPPKSYEDFYQRLPSRSQKFIDLLEDRTQCTVSEAMTALAIDSPKTLGGLAGSLNRWSRAAGLPIPFKQVRIKGQKGYRWTGTDGTLSEVDEAFGGPSAEAATLDIEELKASIPPASKQFIELLVGKGRLSQKDVLAAFGLARAQSINKLLSPIRAFIDERGLKSPIVEEFDGTGQRSYVYGSLAHLEIETDSTLPMTADPDDTKKPGVRIRRRTS